MESVGKENWNKESYFPGHVCLIGKLGKFNSHHIYAKEVKGKKFFHPWQIIMNNQLYQQFPTANNHNKIYEKEHKCIPLKKKLFPATILWQMIKVKGIEASMADSKLW